MGPSTIKPFKYFKNNVIEKKEPEWEVNDPYLFRDLMKEARRLKDKHPGWSAAKVARKAAEKFNLKASNKTSE